MPIDTPRWVRDAVFYQVFPDRFARSGRVPSPGPLEAWDVPPTGTGFKGGDLYGVADHLDHIADLGANAIYLNPIFASTANHRYHTCDYLRIDPLLGGEAAFRHLLDAAHARGMRVVIDGVFNHCGRGFYPFQHVLETGAASPYRDWFFLNPAFLEPGRSIRAYPDGIEPVLELSAVDLGDRDGSATFRDLGYQAWWDLPALPKLNVRNPEVREYLLAAGEHWIRFGVDGWRLDVPEDLEDPDFWREFRRRIRAIDPEAYILAEIWFPKAEVLRGDQYDATMNYPFLTAVVSFAAGSHLDLAVAAQHGWLGAAVRRLDGPGFAALLGPLMTELDPDVVAVQYNLLGSHDTPRLLTLMGGDPASVGLAALVQATLPGAPAVYYGDEIGMTGSIDPAARAAFPWDRPETWDDSIRASLRVVFALRHEQPVLRDGSFRVAGAQGSMVAWVRALDGVVALIVLNNGDAPCDARRRGPGARRLPAPGRAAPGRRRARRVRARIGRLRRLPARPDRAGLPGPCVMSIVTPDWVRDAVFYQVFPDRFARSGRVEAPGPLEDWDAPPTMHGFKGGDLYGVADRLDDLADLGITAIYLTPVFASASNHRYHTYDYFRVDPLLGGDAALRALLDAAHGRGMRVILDGVFNHASRGFWAFNHILECGLASPYLDWFRVDREALAQGRPLRAYPDESLRHAAGGDGGPEGFGTETSFSLGYDAWWNMPALPKLNTDNPQVREYLMRVAEHWIRFGSDGWRLDVAAEIDDDEFWREFRRRVKGVNPDAYIVAEVWNEDHRWLQGDQFDAYMNYQLAFAILSFAAGDHRDQSAIDAHMDVRAGIRHDDGTGLPPPRRAPAPHLRPGRRRGPAEPAGQPRHGADPHDLRRRPGGRPARHARAADAAGRAVHLLRRRDRDGRRPRARVARRVPR